jgi:hypothetical protein
MAQPIEAELVELKERYRLLAEAHEARGRLLARQRWEFADLLHDETELRDGELERLGERIAQLEEQLEGRRRELDDLRNTKTLRYTAAVRRLWGRLRGR